MMFNKQNLLPLALLTGASLSQTTTITDNGGGSDSSTSDSATGGVQCTLSYARLLGAAPTPTGELGSAITSYASSVASASGTDLLSGLNPAALVTQVCDFSSQLPSSLQSDFDAYATSLVSFVSTSSADIDALITNCVASGDEGASYTSVVNSFATKTGPICDTSGSASPSSSTVTSTVTSDDGNGGSTTFTTTDVVTPTPTGDETTGAGGNGQPTSSVQPGAAARPTAMAAVAAGILGAAIML